MYDKLYAQSRRLMKRDPVHVKRELRQFIVDEFVVRLQDQGAEVVVASFDDHHLHVLARFPDRQPRTHMGWAKYHTTKSVKAHGLAVGLGLQLGEGLWAKRGKEKPIANRAHQLEVSRYILKHSRKGGAIWRFDRLDPP